ncbi:putative ribonuclease H-like domain-containing protein [Tanacetum coccineum]
MLDYGFNFMNTKIYIDNESILCIVKNPVYHSKTKHIAIRLHFIRDAYEKILIQELKIHTDENVADLLTKAFDVSSSIHHALTVSPVVSTTFVEQFWTSAKSKIINNVRHITAKVAGKPVSISEASIRSDLLFDDANGIDSLPNQAIFDAIQLMGSKSTSWDQIPTNIATAVICLTSNQKYNFSKLIFDGMLRHLDAKKKFVMYPRFISIFLDKQLENVPVPLDHFPVNALTSKVFSFMVKKGKHFSGKVTPLFASMLVQPTEDEGAPSERPSEAQPTPSPPHPSEATVDPQSDPSPRPSPSTTIPDSIPESSGGNHGGFRSSQGNSTLEGTDQEAQEASQTCYHTPQSMDEECLIEAKIGRKEILKEKLDAKGVCIQTGEEVCQRKSSSKKQRVHKESVSKQGRKFAKGEPSVQRDPLFDEIPEDTVDHMETENAQDVGRIREIVDEEKENDENIVSTEDVLSTDKEKVSTAKEKVSSDRPIVSTDRQIEGTDEQIESTDEQRKGTEDHTKEGSATQATQTPTSTIFGDDETIAKTLALLLQDHFLTLKPLPPKIDPKDKGKKKIEEEDESESESDGIPEAEKKFKQLESDEEMARKMQEEKFLAQQRSEAIRNRSPTKNQLRNQMMNYLKHVGNFKHSELKTKKFEEIQALYEKIKRSDEDFISIGSVEDERLIKRMNEKGIDSSKSEVIKEESKEEVKEENKEEESTRKRKLGTRKKMKSRKRRYIQNIFKDDSEKENDELRLHLTIAPDEENEVDYEILDRKYPIKEWKT